MKVLKSLAIELIFLTIIHLNKKLFVETLAIKITKVECLEYDKTFINFKKCYLKVIERNKIGVNIYVQLLKTPVDNIKVSEI